MTLSRAVHQGLNTVNLTSRLCSATKPSEQGNRHLWHERPSSQCAIQRRESESSPLAISVGAVLESCLLITHFAFSWPFFFSFLMASSNVWKHGLVAGPRNFSVRVCRALYIALLSTTRFYTTAVHHSDGTALCLLNEHQLVSTESIKFPMPCISLYSLLKHQSVKCCHTEKCHSPFSLYIFVCAKGQPLAFKGNQTSRFWHPIFILVQRAGGF